ncbi:MAG: DNA cytosine methyltransferase [Armatimonadota bacterium]|nr:DNA cytosine methyltransferase [Armatimonadota bacterium]
MDAVSLFSGAGGLDYGLEQAGFSIRVQVDSDPWCVRTLRANWHAFSGSPLILQEDVRRLDPEDVRKRVGLGKVTLLCGGPPCQPFSHAGRRMGLRDPRGLLVYEFLRFVEALQPDLFLFEQVYGFKTARLPETGQSLADWYSEECSRLGYSVTSAVLDAADYGTPQRRKRLFVVGCRHSCPPDLPAPTHLPLFGQPPVTLREALAGLDDARRDGAVNFSRRVREVLEQVPPGGDWRDLPEPLRSQVMPRGTGNGGRTSFFRRLSWDEPSPTVTGHPWRHLACMCHPDETRPLTIRELARLQGFPDWWRFEGPVRKRYQQVGNAVPVQLARALGMALLSHVRGRDHG